VKAELAAHLIPSPELTAGAGSGVGDAPAAALGPMPLGASA
jgi:hypothetical protein